MFLLDHFLFVMLKVNIFNAVLASRPCVHLAEAAASGDHHSALKKWELALQALGGVAFRTA